MKKNLSNSIKMLIAFFGFAMLLTSCEYKEIQDADYPAAKLYMPAATNGIFAIDNVPQRVEFLPTSGQAYRFKIDLVRNKLIVPMSVYRSGVDKTSKITVNVVVNTDTINTLKNMLPIPKIPVATVVLPANKYTIPTSVVVASGSQTGTFDLEIDLDYLKSFPDAVIGIGVGITSTDVEVNPLFKTTIITLSTKILNPTAAFTSSVDAVDKSKVTFPNTSTFGMKYSWDFGDGTSDTTKVPVHFYAASGSYTVKLTVKGVLGTVNQALYTLPTQVVIAKNALPNFIYSVAADNIKQINFMNISKNAVSYSWNFGDATPVSTEVSPLHVFAAAGTYNVVLTATADNATTATKSIPVVVK